MPKAAQLLQCNPPTSYDVLDPQKPARPGQLKRAFVRKGGRDATVASFIIEGKKLTPSWIERRILFFVVINPRRRDNETFGEELKGKFRYMYKLKSTSAFVMSETLSVLGLIVTFLYSRLVQKSIRSKTIFLKAQLAQLIHRRGTSKEIPSMWSIIGP